MSTAIATTSITSTSMVRTSRRASRTRTGTGTHR